MRCGQSESASGHDDDFSSREWSRLRRILCVSRIASLNVMARVSVLSSVVGVSLLSAVAGVSVLSSVARVLNFMARVLNFMARVLNFMAHVLNFMARIFLDIFLGKAKQKHLNIQVFHAPCMEKHLGDRKDEWKKIQTTEARGKNVRPRAVSK